MKTIFTGITLFSVISLSVLAGADHFHDTKIAGPEDCKVLTDTIFLLKEVVCYAERETVKFQQCEINIDTAVGTHRYCCEAVDHLGNEVVVCKDFVVAAPPVVGYAVTVLCDELDLELNEDPCGMRLDTMAGRGRYGCDSVVMMDFSSIETDVDLSVTCDNGNYCISAAVSFVCDKVQPLYAGTWIDKLSGAILAQQTEIICTNIPGEYCFLIQAEYLGSLCPPTMHCVEINESGVPPAAPVIHGPEKTKPDTLTYTANLPVQGGTPLQWSLNKGQLIYADNDSAVVDLSLLPPGVATLCAEYSDDCGTSKTCFDIEVLPARTTPVIKIGIRGDTVTFGLGLSGIYSYHWDFGDGRSSVAPRAVHVYKAPGTYRVVLTAQGYEGELILTEYVTVEAITGSFTAPLILFPNPAGEQAFIQLGEAPTADAVVQLEIYHTNGALVLLQELRASTGQSLIPVDLGSLPAGLYLAVLKYGEQVHTGKLTRLP